MTILVKFDQDAWEGFLFREGFAVGVESEYKTLVDFILSHNGRHVIEEAMIRFDTEEDAIIFRLKFGL